MDLRWYVRRLRAMSPREVVHRLRDEFWHQALRFPFARTRPGSVTPAAPRPLPSGAADDIDADCAAELIATADGILSGRWSALGTEWTRLAPEPDWSFDPATGVASDPATYAFDLNPRDAGAVGNVKNVWELSRHHHITILAAAYFVSGEDRYAQGAAAQLRSWWRSNPPLRGINWTSGIELGIRLIAWVWVRRLLASWPGVSGLFESSAEFTDQLFAHQSYLDRFQSHGSSANNHLVAEQAGQFAAACGFPMFPKSAAWRVRSAALLEREAVHQTFPSGLNREMASDYHGFVLELFLAAAIEGERAGHPLSDALWDRLTAMADAGAAFVDGSLRAPRQGDGDEGIALALDGERRSRWRSLLPTMTRLVGRCDWWPGEDRIDVRSALWTAALPARSVAGRPSLRPNMLPDAGLVLLRTHDTGADEIWCRCDGGPFGFLSIAGHAHADALSVELRIGGVDVLTDPGTYCYHVEPEWRSYFRSTRAHNTLEIDGKDQAEPAGPFNWSSRADAETVAVAGLDTGPVAMWTGRHGGYQRLDDPVLHERTVSLHRAERRLTITDRIEATRPHDVVLAFHVGPTVSAEIDGAAVRLEWDRNGTTRRASMRLPHVLEWRMARGETEPPRGWYSPHMGCRIPAVTLFGVGTMDGDTALESVVELHQED